ncbi:MAG: aspartate/glutamate racemase family protein, partial [Myxococcota bacterium]
LAELPATQIGVLATDACIESALYHDAIRERGLRSVDLGADSQKRLMDTIFAIKAGDVGASSSSARHVQALAKELVDAGAQALLIACTEIPMVLEEATVPMVNSTRALARATVQRVKGRAVGRN